MSQKQNESIRPGTLVDPDRVATAFRELCEVIARLRAPDGCPWDREQTLATIKPFTLEETYELLEAIDSGDDQAITEELGDVLLQVVLDAQIGADEGRFNILDVIEVLKRKMIVRHPHVFAKVRADTADEVRANWERIKAQEKGQQRESALDGVPLELPALARAARLSKKAARAAYDWPHRAMLFDKLREEVQELVEELYPDGDMPVIPAAVDMEPVPDEPIDDPRRMDHIEEEIGDILFVVANIARRWGVNPEEALRRSNRKFAFRFQQIEKGLAERGKTIAESNLQEMEALYQAAKKLEKLGK